MWIITCSSKIIGGVIFHWGMVAHPIWYEGLERSQSHPCDQVLVQSQAKDVSLSQMIYIDMILAFFSMYDSNKVFSSFRIWNHAIKGLVSQNTWRDREDKCSSLCLNCRKTHICNALGLIPILSLTWFVVINLTQERIIGLQ